MPKRALRLVAFDVEGCLTTDPTIWEIMHRKLGTWDSHGEPYWRRYLAGELEYDEFARMDVAAWRGAPLEMLGEAAREVPLMAGCAEMLAALTSAGIRVTLISNGLTRLANRLRRQFGLADIYANRALSSDGRLSGELAIDVPYAGKGRILRELAERLNLRRDQIAAVGDSPSDIAMFGDARVGIAFRPTDDCVAKAATCVVADGHLSAVRRVLLD